MFKAIVIILLIYVVLKVNKADIFGMGGEESRANVISTLVSTLKVNESEIEVLEEEVNYWYKAKVGGLIYEVYVAEETGEVSTIIYGSSVIYEMGDTVDEMEQDMAGGESLDVGTMSRYARNRKNHTVLG